MVNVLALHMPGIEEWIVIALIGVVFFGKRLPEVGRSLGKGIVEFKKGLKGIEEEVEMQSSLPAARPAASLPASGVVGDSFKFDPSTGQPLEAKIPADAKFDPYTGKPIA